MGNEASEIIEVHEKRKMDLILKAVDGIRGNRDLKRFTFEDKYKAKCIWWTRNELLCNVGQQIRASMRLKYVEVKPDGEKIYYIKHLRVLGDSDEY